MCPICVTTRDVATTDAGAARSPATATGLTIRLTLTGAEFFAADQDEQGTCRRDAVVDALRDLADRLASDPTKHQTEGVVYSGCTDEPIGWMAWTGHRPWTPMGSAH